MTLGQHCQPTLSQHLANVKPTLSQPLIVAAFRSPNEIHENIRHIHLVINNSYFIFNTLTILYRVHAPAQKQMFSPNLIDLPHDERMLSR